jgi:hypothetical protein
MLPLNLTARQPPHAHAVAAVCNKLELFLLIDLIIMVIVWSADAFFYLYLHVAPCHRDKAFLSVYIYLCLSAPSRTAQQHSTHASTVAPYSIYACMHMHVFAIFKYTQESKPSVQIHLPDVSIA